MGESHGTLDQVSIRIDDLERRVCALERREGSNPEASRAEVAPGAGGTQKQELDTGSIFAVFGQALLGIAGAYMLRAVAASGSAPRLLVAAIGALYAFGWLMWGLRSPRTLPRYVFAGTSALILAPLVWETTLRFNAVTPVMAAGVLAGFATLATLLESRDGNARTMWIVQGMAAVTAATLGFGTHQVLPFVFALLIATFVVELARVQKFPQPAWPLIALVTDTAIWGMIFVYSGPESARGEYTQLNSLELILPGLLLFAINGFSVVIKAVALRLRIGIFETIQIVIAFGLAIASLLYFTPKHGEHLASGLCMALSAALYAFSFIWLRQQAESRNFRVFGTWSGALLIAGVLLGLHEPARSILLAVAACAAYWIAVRINSTMLELHGAAFLVAAACVSGMAQYVFGSLAGSLPNGLRPGIFAVSVCALLAYAADRKVTDESWQRIALQFVPALLLVCGVCAFVAHGAVALWAHAMPVEAHQTAFLRTLAVSLVSLCLAFTGSRWRWVAMSRLAYAALAFLAAKLLFEDLRHGHMVFIAGSIFLFALTLIVVPRVMWWGAKLHAARQMNES